MSVHSFWPPSNQRNRRNNSICNLYQHLHPAPVFIKQTGRQGYNVYSSHQLHHHHHHHQNHQVWIPFEVCANGNARQRFAYTLCHLTAFNRLNKEIVSLYNDMRPTKEERSVREKLIEQIREAVRSKWSTAEVEVFGSFKTDLFLPTSDIDLVVRDDHLQRAPFHELKDELVARNICDKEKVVVLDNASVPIIKLTDKLNNIKVDIGFNIANVQESARLTQEYMQEFPSLPYLVIVLKQFLVERELNEVYSGGISSYSLILMVISFLKVFQTWKRASHVEMNNYGHLLLHFLYHYSFEFRYMTSAVCINSSTGFVPRTDNHNTLSIQDPLCAGNDVARGSYRFIFVHTEFVHAFNVLRSCLEKNRSMILSEVIKISVVHKYRDGSHFGDGSGDRSDSAGSLSAEASSVSSGDTDSDSGVSVKTVPSESSDESCDSKSCFDAVVSPSLISESSPADSPSQSSHEASLLNSESAGENSGFTVAGDTAINERLSNVKIEDEAKVIPHPPPDDGPVCDDNNNSNRVKEKELLETCFANEIQRISSHSQVLDSAC